MPSHRLVVYSRADCHLCDVAIAALGPLLRRHGLTLEVRDVETDPDWERRYGDQVPVGFLGTRKIFKYRVDPERVERAFSAGSR